MKALKVLPPLLVGGMFWLAVSGYAGTAEPWDAPRFWSLAYPSALGAAAVWGGLQPRGGWLCGALIVLALFPVLLLARAGGGNDGEGGLMIVFGAGIVLALALPAAALAWLGGRIRLLLSV